MNISKTQITKSNSKMKKAIVLFLAVGFLLSAGTVALAHDNDVGKSIPQIEKTIYDFPSDVSVVIVIADQFQISMDAQPVAGDTPLMAQAIDELDAPIAVLPSTEFSYKIPALPGNATYSYRWRQQTINYTKQIARPPNHVKTE
jgi:hypothetical protein